MGRSKLPGSVFQRADGKWVAQLRRTDPATGRTRPVRRYAASERDAQKLLRELRAGTEPAGRPASGSVTVAAQVLTWTETTLPVAGLKPSTVTLYTGTARSLVAPTLGAVLLDRFTPSQAEAWLHRLAERGVSGTRQRTAFTIVAKALDTAVRDGLIQDNPLRKVRRPTARPATVPATDPTDVDRLLASCDGWGLGPLVTFVALTGARIGEALSLRWADVDLDGGVAVLRASAVGADSTKGGRSRAIPLLPELVTVLRRHRTDQRHLQMRLGAGWPNTGLVFTSAVGTPMDGSNARQRLARRLRDLGLDDARPFHSLRHGLAARLLRRDVPMPVVSALLGHSSIRVTVDTYGHVQPVLHADQLAAAMSRP